MFCVPQVLAEQEPSSAPRRRLPHYTNWNGVKAGLRDDFTSLESLYASWKTSISSAKASFASGAQATVESATNYVSDLEQRFEASYNATAAVDATMQLFKNDFFDKELCIGLTHDDDYCAGGSQYCYDFGWLGEYCQTLPEVCAVEDVLQHSMTYCLSTPQSFFGGTSHAFDFSVCQGQGNGSIRKTSQCFQSESSRMPT